MAINPSTFFIAAALCEISHTKIGLFYGLPLAKIVSGPPNLPQGGVAMPLPCPCGEEPFPPGIRLFFSLYCLYL